MAGLDPATHGVPHEPGSPAGHARHARSCANKHRRVQNRQEHRHGEALSIQPDSRGLDPGIHGVPQATALPSIGHPDASRCRVEPVDRRVKPGDDEVRVRYREPDSRGLDPGTHAVPHVPAFDRARRTSIPLLHPTA